MHKDVSETSEFSVDYVYSSFFCTKTKVWNFYFANLGFFVLWFVWLSTVLGQPFFKPKVTTFSTPIFHGQPVLAIFDEQLRFLSFAF